jgi:outer membrane biosynthesis protein TonB
MFSVYINRGYAYFDEKTNTHLTRTNPKRVFSDKEIETLDMKGILRGVRLGTLKREDIEVEKPAEKDVEPIDESAAVKDKEESKKSAEEPTEKEEAPAEKSTESEEDKKNEEEPAEEDFSEEEKEEDNEFEELTDDGEPRCQAAKSDGTQCTFTAKEPEGEPIYCGRHSDLLEE